METALEVALFLEAHPEVRRVSYPGLESHPQNELARRQMLDHDGHFAPGIMIYFELDGEGEEVRRRGARVMDFLAENALTITLAVSLGQIRTLIEHPSSMTHAGIPIEAQIEAGMSPGGIRLSIGLEHPADLIADLEQGLAALRAPAPRYTESLVQI
jgi:cystathionine beta-lyase/cystathionine gamma-synthase